MVPIFTHRDERKLFSIIAGIAGAILIILLQVTSARTSRPNPIALTVGAGLAVGQTTLSWVISGIGNVLGGILDIPRLWHDNAVLVSHDQALSDENARLRRELFSLNDERNIERIATTHPRGIVADTIGYDPENQSRIIVINRGSLAGVSLDEGVINDEGTVGRIIRVGPLSSTVLLITDPSSKVPAVVERGHWWGIATGTNGRVQLQYISQDAPLRVGDRIVTGRGLAFQAGLPIGRIAKVYHSEGALYQTALIDTAVSFGRLSHVLVLK